MGARVLAPEVRLDLQIQLDRLAQANEQCRTALDGVSNGKIGPEDYARLIRKQRDLQAAWERKNRDYRLGQES